MLAQILADPPRLEALVAPLDDEATAALVDGLKAEADRHLWINANRSLELGDLLVRIGEVRANRRQIALGTMQRADALRALGEFESAWRTFGEAGDGFNAAGDEIGWARTRIGRLLCCIELGRVAEALADAERARAIFRRHGEDDRLLALTHNTAIIHGQIGRYREALAIYAEARALAEAMGERGRRNLGRIVSDTGYAYQLLGEFREAQSCYERARALCEEQGETSALALVEVNMATVAIAQGRHRRALQLLLHARDLYLAEQLPLDATDVNATIVECYLELNRYAEARDLAEQTAASYRSYGAAFTEALTLQHLATAEAALGAYEQARTHLATAEALFLQIEATKHLATTRLRRGQLALHTGDTSGALRAAAEATAAFAAGGVQVERAAAELLRGQALLAEGAAGAAGESGAAALAVARRNNLPALRYSGHLLLGRGAESRGALHDAARHYAAAIATIDRVQRGLTITLRPGFLEDKGEALRRLMGLQLGAGQAARAFETLERAKARTLLGYLGNREQLRWAGANDHARTLLDELERLREEHHWYSRLAEGPNGQADEPAGLAPEQARAELAARERRMRAISERLYLDTGNERAAAVSVPSLDEIQARLEDGTLLLAYYNDGARLWAFTVDRATLVVQRLPADSGEIDRLLAQLQANMDFALSAGADGPATRRLTAVAQRILQRLHAALLAPLAARIAACARLLIVPYGALHYLPFHLLRDESSYLIERREVVVLPAAALAARQGPARSGGARVLAHSWQGRLPQTSAEARIVARLFGGALHAEAEASRAALQHDPCQILHIAAHGQHRLDQPDLSFIQLADGQLYTDDLLQQDLSYELVVLSACETGRANVAAGDELIGLGRGFLYAGAGAMIASLWRVPDDTTLTLMEHLYGGLRRGATKAAALRDAQRALLCERPDLHPALWGAFQLVGDARPLTHADGPRSNARGQSERKPS